MTIQKKNQQNSQKDSLRSASETRPPTLPSQVASSMRSLVWVNDAPLRSQVSQEFTKLYKTYARHVADLEHHEKKVRPSYYLWIAGLFGSQIQNVADLQAELVRKSTLLQRMRELCIFEGFSRLSAFERAQQEIEAEQEGFDFDIEDETEPETDDFSNDEEDLFEGNTRQERVSDKPHDPDETDWIGDRPFQPSEDEKTDRHDLAKSFYRKLAQALHPDMNGEQTELLRELWEETQDAYRRLDLDHLKMIWTVVSLQTQSHSREMRLFDLRAAVSSIKSKLRSVKSTKRRLARQDPSWSFEKKNRSDLAHQIRSELEQEQSLLLDALEEVDENLEEFSRGPRSKPNRRSDRY